nr:hypothetical protein [uncultured Anaerostipes sp.]
MILTRKEGEVLTEQEIRDIGIRCALRHTDSLRMQAAEGKKADFTEPCKNCPELETCGADWSKTTRLNREESGYIKKAPNKSVP